MNSVAGTDGLTTITVGMRRMPAIWHHIANEIELEIAVERRVGRVRGAVRARIDDGLGGDVGARTRAIIDCERLPEPTLRARIRSLRGSMAVRIPCTIGT
jgi:hypothetical protein